MHVKESLLRLTEEKKEEEKKVSVQKARFSHAKSVDLESTNLFL
jgi:hypothetical protein